MKIIEGEFGCPVSHMFSYVSDEPVASASFGQVISSCASFLPVLC
jgi:aarF domain-containing kinase